MKKIATLNELLIENLRALYDAEIMIQNVIPKMIDKASSSDLKAVLLKYNKKIERKIERLDQIFVSLKKNSIGNKNKVIDRIVDSSKILLKYITKEDVRDAAIIAELQRINHLFITDYGTACAFSKTLGMGTVAKHLHYILEDEKHTDEILSFLAKEKINSKAKDVVFTY